MKYGDLYLIDPYAFKLLHRAFFEAGRTIKVGTKVKPTEWAIQNNVEKRRRKGIVIKNNDDGITVLIDGLKTPGHYWNGFWRKIK